MNDARAVVPDGRVYIDKGDIVAVKAAGDPAPDGFVGAPVLTTGGTVYPGLIELHNHLSYDVLPAWTVPKAFTNRGQWDNRPDYRENVTGPMAVLGRHAGFIEAIVRYVEAKCLVAGTTTSQGLTLTSNQSIIHHYRGIVRNVEQTADPVLPNADTRVADVDPGSAAAFLTRLESVSTLLLHLSEGVDDVARQRFERLKISGRKWAITPALAGIHCAGLQRTDFDKMARRGGQMVWSPFSNLLLYGATARIAQAKRAGMLIALGSDWSPSGSKNLLGELKIARIVNASLRQPFASDELVAMATINPARILKWDHAIGTVEATKRADLIVIEGTGPDDYNHLIGATEADVSLVVINGIPRCGLPKHMAAVGTPSETVTIAGRPTALDLAQATEDPVVAALPLADATARLREGMSRLPDLAAELDHPQLGAALVGVQGPGGQRWVLELDHNPEHRHGRADPALALSADLTAGGAPLSTIVKPMELDALTMVDDATFFTRLAEQPALDPKLAKALAEAYGVEM